MGQRFVPRGDRRFSVGLSALYMGEDCVGQARVTNLSLNGWRLLGIYPVDPGAELSLRVYLDDEESPVNIPRALVRWARGHEFGIELGTLPPATRKRLREWVCVLAQDAYERLSPAWDTDEGGGVLRSGAAVAD